MYVEAITVFLDVILTYHVLIPNDKSSPEKSTKLRVKPHFTTPSGEACNIDHSLPSNAFAEYDPSLNILTWYAGC